MTTETSSRPSGPETHQPLSVTEKLGYSLGDLAANLIFQTLVMFLAFFYTDVSKIPLGPAGYVMLIGGWTGALVFTPLMGIIADRTNTRWGKFRPWILWTSIPFGVIAVLAFTVPDLGDTSKIIYAFGTYFLLVGVYAANNLPYSALSGVLTGSMADRNSLSSYRFIAVMFAQFVVQVLLLPLVLILGAGDKTVGFKYTMMVFSIIGVVCFLITFATTRERIVSQPEERSSVREDLGDLFRNRPWIVMVVLTTLVFITLALKGGLYVYYFKDYLAERHLAEFLEDIGWNAFIDGLNAGLVGIGLAGFKWPEDAPTSAFSLFNAAGIVFTLIGILFSKSLADRYGKRDVFRGALLISTVFLAAFYFYPPDAIGWVFLSQALHGFFYGITTPLLWAMIADVADFSEWKNHRRATAIIFSAMMVGLKLGLSTGGALVTSVLAWHGYDAELAVQAPETALGIKLSISIYASIPFLVGIAALFWYEIDKKLELRIEAELQERRRAKVTGADHE